MISNQSWHPINLLSIRAYPGNLIILGPKTADWFGDKGIHSLKKPIYHICRICLSVVRWRQLHDTLFITWSIPCHRVIPIFCRILRRFWCTNPQITVPIIPCECLILVLVIGTLGLHKRKRSGNRRSRNMRDKGFACYPVVHNRVLKMATVLFWSICRNCEAGQWPLTLLQGFFFNMSLDSTSGSQSSGRVPQICRHSAAP